MLASKTPSTHWMLTGLVLLWSSFPGWARPAR